MKRDIFLRLPQPMAMLLLSALLNLTAAHTVYPLPRQSRSSPQPTTTTVSHHVIDAVPFPPLPTSPPRFRPDLLRRQGLNTICGYIGGDPNLPATCGLGSHCVLDTQHGAVGCCPNGEPTCTTGVFTGCVDGNSPPQTEVNPYVFTCQGGDVCYRNVFDGGFFQFGCGTASDLATSVFATATGITQDLNRPSLTFSFTETPATLGAPTTLGSVTVPSSTGVPTSTEATTQTSSTAVSSSASSTSQSLSSTSSASRSSSSSSITSSSSSTTSSCPSSSTTLSQTATLTSPTSNLITASSTGAPSQVDPQSRDHTGAIVGGTISGVAVLVAAIALGIYLWRRKKPANERQGPTSGSTEYISPMQSGPYPGGGFAPLHQDQEGWETGMTPARTVPGGNDLMGAAGIYPGHPAPNFSYPPARTGYDYPSQYPTSHGSSGESSAAGAAAVFGGAIPPSRPGRGMYERDVSDQVPLTREIDDFSRGFHDALGRIGEEDEYDNSPNNSRAGVNEGNGVSGPHGTGRTNGSDDGTGGPYGSVRPLWQQQRRQSRNLMWM